SGAISSLQRELERQECHLRRTRSEKAELQKKLTVQQEQLQAMTDKFHSLREEHKHEEVLAMMEEENRSLRQVVGEQESKLAEQNKLISELEETVTQLRAEGLSSCCQVQELKRAQKEIQSQAEALQHSELQARVALESTSSKFERFRSKILQAVFSIEGSQAPSAELTDEELLDAMQKIIKERMEFHRVLKQKGIK
ncbi:Coiled-coil domain-containing protein 27, partial [Acanthisitta chloris]